MKKITFFTLLIIILLIPYSAKSQCPNLNFSNGDFRNWQGYLGSCGSGVNINPSAITPGRHTIMDGAQLLRANQLYDERCLKIKKVPDGFAYAAKLGNESTGAEMEAIEYTLKVDSSNSLLLVHFAYIMEYINDTLHFLENQPRFTIAIKDSAGNNIPSSTLPCAFYDFISSPDLDDLTCTGNIVARDWTTIGYSLEPLMGRTIKIYFETRDCTQSGHFGYAYLVAECRSMTIDLQYCEGQASARFRAPDGFKKYTWTRSIGKPSLITSGSGRNYQNITLTDAYNEEIITCEVESALSPECSATLKTVVKKTSIDATFGYGVLSNGEVDFPVNQENWYDTCNRTTTFVDRSKVVNSKKVSRSWTIHGLDVVLPRDSMITVTFPDPGLVGLDSVRYLVRLTVGVENGCVDTSKALADHYITIYASPQVEITGPTEMCQLDTIILKFNAVRADFIAHEWTWYDLNNVKHNSTDDFLKVTYPETYYLEAEDMKGCIIKDTHVVTYLNPQIGIIEKQGPSCFGGNDGRFEHGPMKGGKSPYLSFTWSVLDSNMWPLLHRPWKYDSLTNTYIDPYGNTTGKMYTGLPAGSYIFEAIDLVGCILKGEIEITQPEVLEIFAIQEAAAKKMNNGKIFLHATGGTRPYHYSVIKNDNTISLFTDSIASGLTAGTYSITVTDINGCTAKDSIIVEERTCWITLQSNNLTMGTVGFLQFTNESDTVIFQAMANSGYRFVQWNDNIIDNPRTIILTQDTSFTAEFTSIVNIKEVETYANHINLFPNPVQSTLYFQSFSKVEQVIIYDISGRILKQVFNPNKEINVSNLANGIYLVKVKTTEGEVIQKIIKQ